MIPVLFTLLMGALPQEKPNEAEKLFREFEERFRKAKSLALHFDSEIGTNAKDDQEFMKGKMRLKPGDLFAIQVSLGGDVRKVTDLRIKSDGKTTTINDGKDVESEKTKLGFSKFMSAGIARAGVVLLQRLGPGKEIPNPDAYMELSNFSIGEDKIGTIVRYTLKVKNLSIEMELWLDKTTLTPLKRAGSFKGDRITTFTEVYSKVFVNEIPDEDFEH